MWWRVLLLLVGCIEATPRCIAYVETGVNITGLDDLLDAHLTTVVIEDYTGPLYDQDPQQVLGYFWKNGSITQFDKNGTAAIAAAAAVAAGQPIRRSLKMYLDEVIPIRICNTVEHQFPAEIPIDELCIYLRTDGCIRVIENSIGGGSSDFFGWILVFGVSFCMLLLAGEVLNNDWNSDIAFHLNTPLGIDLKVLRGIAGSFVRQPTQTRDLL